ncbi:MAG: FAD-dependent oxidoreductase [Lachnospiraceae bacterium]|nr:FAD-dependent oxidoreductase [Lachnospiraceae bacterium]
MIRINQIKLPISNADKELIKKAAGLLGVGQDKILSCKIVKKSIDARKKPEIYFIYTVDIETENENDILNRLSSGRSHRNKSVQITKVREPGYIFPNSGEIKLDKRPVIIGTGPAGLFCGYYLALYGYRPILLERGKAVDERRKDVEEFWKSGVLNTDSNVQFGEGGAGTFSDGKLNTLIKDKSGRNKEVLEVFVRSGAPEEILYEAKPHIGTDILMNVVKNMRNEIIAHGGEVRFESKVTDVIIDGDKITGVMINNGEQLQTDIVVLAIGHSARDTFYMLNKHGVPMEAKSFAVGLRVEHPRKLINKIQYGMEENKHLPTANYKLTAKAQNGRGVYSFCMCPGGYVVNASSEKGRLAINGMSYSKRNGDNSNSAIIITVTPEDFEGTHPLSGVEFQRLLEEKAFEVGIGQVPVETYGDFKQAVTGQEQPLSVIAGEYPDFKPQIKGAYSFAPVHKIFPEALNQSFVDGMEQFGRMIPDFADSGVYVSGVESRTSSPVRIHRDELGQSQINGLYPCGEGAGYAGGITSAAMDGMAIAEKIASVYKCF